MGVVACLLLKGVNSFLTGRVSLVDPFSIEDMMCVYLTGVAIDCCYREAAAVWFDCIHAAYLTECFATAGRLDDTALLTSTLKMKAACSS